MSQSGRDNPKTVMALAAGAALIATGTSTGQDMRGCSEILAILNVLVVSGSASPTMNLKLQVAPTLNGTYADIAGAAFSAVTAAGRQALKIIADNGHGFVRASYTISGTSPSFTVALDLIGLLLHDTVLADPI
jgi:FtsH-binding integral membrane protein